jgi:hypothetical protein
MAAILEMAYTSAFVNFTLSMSVLACVPNFIKIGWQLPIL